MGNKIERGRLKEPPAKEVTNIMVAPTLTDEEVERSYQIYIDVNKAHVLMLEKQGIIKKPVAKAILGVACEMAAMGNKPTFEITPELEEMYFNLENYLIGKVGMEVGGQQHTARSRNDLHATVDRMEVRNAILQIGKELNSFRKLLIELAEKNKNSVMSGYTHLQPSEPMTFAHYLSAVSQALSRDFQRIIQVWNTTNLNPLGGGSMGSTTWNIDREYTTELLGFDAPMENSLDCVCSRDYILQLMSSLAILASNLSRLATDIRIWATPDYGYVEISDSVAVCSSIMPQKKNPWTFESVNTFCARVKGLDDTAWMIYKGVPYAFTMESMDMIGSFWPQLKEVSNILTLLSVSLKDIKVRTDKAVETARKNFSTVTELANTLVRVEGISFRAAHEIVAHMVGFLTEKDLKANQITKEDLDRISLELFNKPLTITDEQIQIALDPVKNAESKEVLGGTAPEEVTRQLMVLKEKLNDDNLNLAKKKEQIEEAHRRLELAVEETIG